MSATPPIKDRRPKAMGSARAAASLRRNLRIDPYVHQSDGLALLMERIERFQSFGLLHDMGCGKTLTVLGMLADLYEQGRAKSMLVVCPSSVVGSWQKECEGINARGYRIECLGLTHASVAKRAAQLTRCLLERDARRAGGEKLPPLVVVMNYEGVWRETMLPILRAAHFDIDCCDESQRIKAPGSKQSFAMSRLGKLTPFRIIMSGTPVPEGGLDWYGQFRFLAPEVFGTSYENFKAKYAIEINMGTFRKIIVNPHTKVELEQHVMERVHRVSKEEAVDLPEQTSTVIDIELTPAQRKIYDDLVRDSLAYVERGDDVGEIMGDNVLTRLLRLMQLTGGFVQLEDEDEVRAADPKKNPKLAALTDLMEDLRDNGKKLVVFHRFTHEGLAIEQVAQRLAGWKKGQPGKHGRPVSVINGSIPADDRKRMVHEFQEGDAQVFVAQIQAAGLGITLHAASDSAVYSMGHSSADYEQALARIHRIGQIHPVTHHHFLARDTVDVSTFESLMRKRDASEDMVDGGWRRFLEGRGGEA